MTKINFKIRQSIKQPVLNYIDINNFKFKKKFWKN